MMQAGIASAKAGDSNAAHLADRSDNSPDINTLLDIFSRASLIRQCGRRIASVIRAGRIVAPYYSAFGQEIIAAAVGAVLKQDDYLITIYRGIHDQLAKGVPLRQLWAEYAGRATGSCK